MSQTVYERCEAADADVKAGPHGWIQWKGTDVCLDVYCSCGAHSHVDAEFAYTIRCGACGKLWAVCANVRFVEISEADLEGRCKPVVSTADNDTARFAAGLKQEETK